MLLPRILQHFPPQLPQPQRHPTPCRMGHDDLVDEPLRCRDERIGEARFIFRRALGDFFGGFASEPGDRVSMNAL